MHSLQSSVQHDILHCTLRTAPIFITLPQIPQLQHKVFGTAQVKTLSLNEIHFLHKIWLDGFSEVFWETAGGSGYVCLVIRMAPAPFFWCRLLVVWELCSGFSPLVCLVALGRLGSSGGIKTFYFLTALERVYSVYQKLKLMPLPLVISIFW